MDCRWVAVNARPLVDMLDQVGGHWVAGGVDQLVDDVLPAHEAHDAGLLSSPEVLPSAAEGILAFSEELVEIL